VDQDRIERGRLGEARVDQRLESRPLVVGGRVPGFDKFGHDAEALGVSVGRQLAALVRNGKVAVGLARGRDAKIERRVRAGRLG
jgi:hypothetical protein